VNHCHGVFHTINRVMHRRLWITGLASQRERLTVRCPGLGAEGFSDPDTPLRQLPTRLLGADRMLSVRARIFGSRVRGRGATR